MISPFGNPTTRCDSGEGWRYVSNSAFPEHLRNQFLSELASFYWKQLQALISGGFDSHPSFPFYQKEEGANLSWLLLDCADLLNRQGIKDEIVEHRPFSLYFSGLKDLTLPSQLNRLRYQALPYLQARLAGIREERGLEAEKLIADAFANAERLSLDSSWKGVSERLGRAL